MSLARFDAKLEQRFAEQDAKIDQRFAEQDVKWERRFGELKSDLVRWTFAFWAGQFLALAAFMWVALRPR